MTLARELGERHRDDARLADALGDGSNAQLLVPGVTGKAAWQPTP